MVGSECVVRFLIQLVFYICLLKNTRAQWPPVDMSGGEGERKGVEDVKNCGSLEVVGGGGLSRRAAATDAFCMSMIRNKSAYSSGKWGGGIN